MDYILSINTGVLPLWALGLTVLGMMIVAIGCSLNRPHRDSFFIWGGRFILWGGASYCGATAVNAGVAGIVLAIFMLGLDWAIVMMNLLILLFRQEKYAWLMPIPALIGAVPTFIVFQGNTFGYISLGLTLAGIFMTMVYMLTEKSSEHEWLMKAGARSVYHGFVVYCIACMTIPDPVRASFAGLLILFSVMHLMIFGIARRSLVESIYGAVTCIIAGLAIAQSYGYISLF